MLSAFTLSLIFLIELSEASIKISQGVSISFLSQTRHLELWGKNSVFAQGQKFPPFSLPYLNPTHGSAPSGE